MPVNRYLFTLLIITTVISSCKKDMTPAIEQKTEPITGIPIPVFGNYWTQLPVPDIQQPPTSNERHLSFTVNGKVYVAVLGYNQLWEYDPATTQWSLKQSTFFTFSDFGYEDVFTNGNSAYFLNATSKTLKIYNVLTNQWTNGANFPGAAKQAGSYSQTATKGYIMAGTNGAHSNGLAITIAENWEYDFAANSWSQKTNTPGFGRYNSASYAIGNNIYFGTGISVIAFLNPITSQLTWHSFINSDWWEYNTVSNTWTQKANFGGGTRQDTRGFVIGSKVYLGLGSTGYFTGLQSDLWSYNPSSNTWTQRATYPPGNGYPPFLTMVGAGGNGFAITQVIDDFWRYTPPITFLPNPVVQ